MVVAAYWEAASEGSFASQPCGAPASADTRVRESCRGKLLRVVPAKAAPVIAEADLLPVGRRRTSASSCEVEQSAADSSGSDE
mmetsp:Transcript_7629/g.28075  ORF Transcript_7629/g.28075 Transcript_7629/m.28075 type:complete len:83 (-) Transcript_7629:1315-1563(-)